MKIYFECDMGCGIRDYPNEEAARRGILREVGTANNVHNVRKATAADISNVKSMGGRA